MRKYSSFSSQYYAKIDKAIVRPSLSELSCSIPEYIKEKNMHLSFQTDLSCRYYFCCNFETLQSLNFLWNRDVSFCVQHPLPYEISIGKNIHSLTFLSERKWYTKLFAYNFWHYIYKTFQSKIVLFCFFQKFFKNVFQIDLFRSF